MKTISTLFFVSTMFFALPLHAQDINLAAATKGLQANVNDQLEGTDYYLISKVEVEKPGWLSSCKQGKTTIFLGKHNSENKYEYKDCCVVRDGDHVNSPWLLEDCDMLAKTKDDADYEICSAENGYFSIGWPLTQSYSK